MKTAHNLSHQNDKNPKRNHPVFSGLLPSSANLSALVVDREVFGRMRRELIWSIGEARTSGILARLGVACGLSESLHTSEKKQMLKGLGEIVDRTAANSNNEFIFEVHNSCEAEQHIEFFTASDHRPQCHLFAGYLSGLLSGQTGQSIYFLETRCAAKKDSVCRFVGKPKEDWSTDFSDALTIYEQDNMELELITARENLKLTKDRYQNLFEQLSSPIFIVDVSNAAFIDINLAAEDITGYTKEELLKMTVFDIRPNRDHHKVMARIKAVSQGEHVPDGEVVILRNDKSERVVLLSTKVITYGGIKAVQAVMRDVTELKVSEQKERDLQDQLSRSERLSSVGRLAAGVAHEIKNPLGAIRNAIYYIRNSIINTTVVDNDPQIKEIIKLAEEEVDGAVRIIEELLDFSRVVSLIPRKTNINDLLKKIPSVLPIPENISLKLDLDITLPSAMVDPERLNQVFGNIVTNACQAMQNGGSLTIKTRLQVGSAGEDKPGIETIEIIFEDTGAGIHQNHIKKIFEPLFSTKARGTGLGLAISSNIIEKHGGKISVTSQVGKGTSFTVKLPLIPPKSSEEDDNGHKENSAR